MSMLETLPAPVRIPLRAGRRIVGAGGSSLDRLGEQLAFYIRAIGWTGKTLRRYKREVLRLIAEVTLGTGSLAVILGTVGVIAFLTFFTGAEVGLEGYQGLQQIGIERFAGFISAYLNTREIAPIVTGLALSATVGSGFTATLGAMRVNEEVDALEVMGIPSIPYLVTTRVIAGMLAVIPLYVVGLFSSYFATRFIVTNYYHQSSGTYDTNFFNFLAHDDVIYSFLKVIIFAVVIVLIHCYYGYYAQGGPAGVGVAVGRAVRTSLVAINVIDFFLSLAIWGANTTVRIAG
jgi:phospholipid/cholesterol/gamma-HCH transport system permease protein